MRVVSAGFAAVKGTRHLARDEVVLDADGPVGDRELCVVDADRHQVVRTVSARPLLAVRAATSGDVVELALPDGETVTGPAEPTGERLTCDYWGRPVELTLTAGPHADALSGLLGRSVRLARAPRGGVVYGSPVTLLSMASVGDLGERTGRDLTTSTARFRMTLLVDAGAEPYAEDRWCGREVALDDGSGVVLQVERPVPRCAVVDLDPITGEKDGSLLKVLAGYRPATGGEPWLGVQARVVRPGRVSARG